MKEYPVRINTKKESQLIVNLRKKIRKEVIGQERAIRRLLRAVASYYSGLKDPRRPIGGFIFAGPTGVGKTWTAKVFARHFLGGQNTYKDYLIRIDGSTLSQEHEIARLTGAPPGYIGYDEPASLSQINIDSYHFDVKCGKDDGSLANMLKEIERIQASLSRKGYPSAGLRQKIDPYDIEHLYSSNASYCSVILFDEIEKAHQNIWNVLLQIMEEGEIQLGKSSKKTRFANSVIILTTNVGQRDIQEMLRYYRPQTTEEEKDLDNRIYKVVKEKVKSRFPPELFKRLDLVVFRPLKEKDFIKILDNFLLEEEKRLNEKVRRFSKFTIELNYTFRAKKFLLKEGVDIYYGARTLRAAIEKHVRSAIANGIASGEIRPGDKILIDEREEELIFWRKYRQRGQNAVSFRLTAKENEDHLE